MFHSSLFCNGHCESAPLSQNAEMGWRHPTHAYLDNGTMYLNAILYFLTQSKYPTYITIANYIKAMADGLYKYMRVRGGSTSVNYHLTFRFCWFIEKGLFVQNKMGDKEIIIASFCIFWQDGDSRVIRIGTRKSQVSTFYIRKRN